MQRLKKPIRGKKPYEINCFQKCKTVNKIPETIWEEKCRNYNFSIFATDELSLTNTMDCRVHSIERLNHLMALN